MKQISVLLLLGMLLVTQACTPKEKIRVQNVVGPYDCAWACTETDLTGQNAPVNTSGTETVFVRKAEDWEDGYILIGDRLVFLLEDSTFSISETDYFFSGEFTASGELVFTETTVDQDADTRKDCDFIGPKK